MAVLGHHTLQCFHVSFLVSRLLRGFITLLLQTLAFYYVNDEKIHTSEHMKDLGSHFLETALGPSVWIQNVQNIFSSGRLFNHLRQRSMYK